MNSIAGKIGLVVEGGGMKCAYSAGILDRMLDEGITFDYGIGVSAGSANLASFMAGQRERNLRFYTVHPKEPDYFGAKSFLTTGNLFNLKYIYADLSNSDGADPLDYPALVSNPAQFVVVATNARTGRPTYFTKDDMHQDDYRIIMASSALPAACRPIRIGSEDYYDGGVSDSIPVSRALLDGCDRVVVLLSKNRDFVKPPQDHRKTYTAMLQRYPAVIRALNRRHLMYNRSMSYMFDLESRGKVFVMAPSEKMASNTYNMDIVRNRELYDLGIRDFNDRLDELKAFLRP